MSAHYYLYYTPCLAISQTNKTHSRSYPESAPFPLFLLLTLLLVFAPSQLIERLLAQSGVVGKFGFFLLLVLVVWPGWLVSVPRFAVLLNVIPGTITDLWLAQGISFGYGLGIIALFGQVPRTATRRRWQSVGCLRGEDYSTQLRHVLSW